MSIAEHVTAVREQIAAACQRANRLPDAVTLIAVSKTHPAPLLLEAAASGIRHFGENRVEEAGKIHAVAQHYPALTWHMIGHVQSRKARDVIDQFSVIHSLDSLKLAERYSRLAVESGRTPHFLLQMNVSGEASKEGFEASQWQTDNTQCQALWQAVRQIIALPGLHIGGLMTIAPVVSDSEAARPVFAALRRLRDALAADFPASDWTSLSMGMTDDYPVAIEEGATLVRVGRAIFGARDAIDSIDRRVR